MTPSGAPALGVGSRRLVEVGPEGKAEAVAVLCDAFDGYPVMRWILGDDYDPRALEALVDYFVSVRFYRSDLVLGLEGPGGLDGVALVTLDEKQEVGPRQIAHRTRLWAELGGDCEHRYVHYGRAAVAAAADMRCHHLGMIGVVRDRQGAGLARSLLDEVHRRARRNGSVKGVSLNTEWEERVDLYRHFGYRVVGITPFGRDFVTYGMFRPVDSRG